MKKPKPSLLPDFQSVGGITKRGKSNKIAKDMRDIVIPIFNKNLTHFNTKYLSDTDSFKNGNLTRAPGIVAALNKQPNRSGNKGKEDIGFAMLLTETYAGLDNETPYGRRKLIAELRINTPKINHFISTYAKLPKEGRVIMDERIFICMDALWNPLVFLTFRLKDLPPELITIRKTKNNPNKMTIATRYLFSKRTKGWSNFDKKLLEYL